MIYKVKSVTPLSDYRLSVEFINGAVKEYDVKALFDQWEAFKALSYIPGLFDLVRVEAGGYGISWNDDIDLACDELFENGVEQRGDVSAEGNHQNNLHYFIYGRFF